jgi:hypothetical protein
LIGSNHHTVNTLLCVDGTIFGDTYNIVWHIPISELVESFVARQFCHSLAPSFHNSWHRFCCLFDDCPLMSACMIGHQDGGDIAELRE